MKLLAKCGSCGKKKFFIRKRQYEVKYTGPITSQNDLCSPCFKGIKKLLNEQVK